MKKILLLALAVGMSYLGVVAQSQRTVVVEEFTQASCPPCETTTPALNTILEANVDKVVQMRYQTSWPGVDPMNADNPDEVAARVSYYGVGGVPNVRLDGAEPTQAVFPELVTQQEIDAAHGVSSPVLLNISHSISADYSSMDVTVTVANEDPSAIFSNPNARLRIAIVEEKISWPAPPGSTSITVFDAVMKSFITGTDGMALNDIAGGESWENTWSGISIPESTYSLNELAVVAFIQDDSNQAMINGAYSHPIALSIPDLALMDNTQVGDDLCDYSFTPGVTVSNLGAGDAMESFNVELYINGNLADMVAVEGGIGAGASVMVSDFDAELADGSSNVSYLVVTNEIDGNVLNQASPTIAIGKAIAANGDIAIDFEDTNLGTRPTFGLFDAEFTNANFVVFNADGVGGTSPVGGYGESERMLLVNFYQWNPASINGSGNMIFLNEYDVPAQGATVSFDRAFTTWGGSNDRLSVDLSTDCGNTFETIWTKAGSELATAPELNNSSGFFIPTADQWETEDIDLSNYIGETIMLRFSVESGWGDMLYLDNIEINMLSGVNDQEPLDFVLGPNPTSDELNISFKNEESSVTNIKILSLDGKILDERSIANSNFVSESFDVSRLNAGMYLINIETATNSFSTKFYVNR